MAKKKPTRSAKELKQTPNNQEETSDSEQPKSAMDDDSKLQSLKSLNERLLKEMVEKRVEVGDLVQSKEALELDLKRNVNEKEQVMGELSEARDGVYGLELERNVVCVYLQSRIQEMGGGICGLLESERVKGLEIRNLKAEITGLVSEVVEMERNERRALEEIDDLKGKCKKLLSEKKECEILNANLTKDNELIKKLLEESGRVIEDLERKVDVKMKEKGEIEKEKNGLEMEVEKLEKEVTQLKQSTFCLKQEKEENGMRIYELQMRNEEALNIIGDLQKESSKLKEAIASLTKMSDVGKARNEELINQIGRLRDTLDEVSFERDDARKRFGDEKEKVEKLSLLLKDKERRIEEAIKEVEKAKIAQEEESLNVKKEMERRINALIGERELMEKNLLAAKSRIDELKAKVNSAVCNSEKALSLLKKTRLTVCDGYGKREVEEVSSDEHKVGKEMQPFVEHLDAIKTSFTNKEKAVEEMTRVLETERMEQQKKKSFFTVVTAATTILAAVSALYVSKGR
uniref:Uncharacterized protein n=1 Tax=Cucumis sativus TaxID=3659 RepID=A0A0A0LII4_CUCSA